MRLWTFHPSYLDVKGLLAVWREGLLAQKVLQGKTKGYKNHPQLVRFKAQENPMEYIAAYLYHVFREAERRKYHFVYSKIFSVCTKNQIPCTDGQLSYEWEHFKNKLVSRNPAHLRNLDKEKNILPHPLFFIIPGRVETWEKIPKNPAIS